MENVALWNQRAHPQWAVIVTQPFLDYMLAKLIDIINNLQVYPENMLRNINRTHGLIFSQRVLLALVEEKGFSRERAYELVQRNAMQSWRTGESFRDLLLKDGDVTAQLSEEEVDELFDFSYHLKHVDEIYKRFGLKVKAVTGKHQHILTKGY